MTSFYYKHSVLNNNSIYSFKTLEQKQCGDGKSYSHIHIRDEKPSGFHNLPTRVLFYIFKYIPEQELRKNIIPVCHKWRQVALLPELWHTIKFQGYQVPSSFICQQLRSFPNLQYIYLINIDDVTTAIRQVCRCNTQIISITIKHCRNDKSDEKVPEKVLRNLIASCRQLQQMNLKGTQFSGNLLYIEVALLPCLKSIDLSNNEFLTTKNIFEFILNCHQLEEFKLSYRGRNQYMSDNDAVFLFSNLKFSLRSITFDMMELTDISFKNLLECEKLEKLYLFNASNISQEMLSSISIKLPYLKYLKIHHSQISTDDLGHICSGNATNLNKLQIINLTGSWRLNSEGLEILAKGCPLLQKAVFKCCKNLDNIECLLENCKKLQILDVSFCNKLSDDNLLSVSLQLPFLRAFYIDTSRTGLVEDIKYSKSDLVVYVCLSEFNKYLKIKF